jgi:hypothetical protein
MCHESLVDFHRLSRAEPAGALSTSRDAAKIARQIDPIA